MNILYISYLDGSKYVGPTYSVPMQIEAQSKCDNVFWYNLRKDGLKEWDNENGYLTDTCLAAQDKYKSYLDFFRIKYDQ